MTLTRHRSPSAVRRPSPAPDPSRRGGGARSLVVFAIVLLVGVALGLAIAPSKETHKAAAPAIEKNSRRVVDGVTVGYPHTEAGAIEAATNYERVLGDPLMLDDVRRTAAMQIMVHPDHLDEVSARSTTYVRMIERGLSVEVGGAAASNSSTWFAPLGFRVESFTGDEATIAIWTVTASDLPPVSPTAGWGTATVTVGWTNGDWKLVDSHSVPGPTPKADPHEPTPPADFNSTARSFRPYGYAT